MQQRRQRHAGFHLRPQHFFPGYRESPTSKNASLSPTQDYERTDDVVHKVATAPTWAIEARLDMLGPVPMGTDLPFAIAEGEPGRLIDAAGFSPCKRAGGNRCDRTGMALVK
jgi:hypothetical protein